MLGNFTLVSFALSATSNVTISSNKKQNAGLAFSESSSIILNSLRHLNVYFALNESSTLTVNAFVPQSVYYNILVYEGSKYLYTIHRNHYEEVILC